MKDLADTLHLRCRSGTWYYVRRVPKVLAPIIGKKFIKHSLNTKDKAQAKKLRPVEDMRADALFAAAENQLAQLSSPQVSIKTPSLDELVEYVRQVVAQTDRCSAESFAQNPPMDQAERHERKAEAGLDLTVYQVPGPEQDEAVSRATEKILNDVGVTLSDADLVSNFAEIVRRGMIELGRRKLDRYDDRYDRAFQDALFDPKRPSEISFGAAVDIFLTERFKDYQINGISQRRIDQVSARAGFICEIVGKNTALSEIDDDAVQRVRDLLSRTPSNMKKAYPNTSLSKAIERAEQDGKPVLSPTTQGAYLDILRDILKVAVRKRLIAYNPAEDVRPLKQQTLSTAERRLPWTEEQIVGFFTGKFYRSCAPNAPMPYKKPDRDWRFWLPLIMLLTGARPGEICQLRVGDIQKTDGGTWYMNLLNEDDQKSSKTFTSRRRVPLHPELLNVDCH